jgi:hypothetical protein
LGSDSILISVMIGRVGNCLIVRSRIRFHRDKNFHPKSRKMLASTNFRFSWRFGQKIGFVFLIPIAYVLVYWDIEFVSRNIDKRMSCEFSNIVKVIIFSVSFLIYQHILCKVWFIVKSFQDYYCFWVCGSVGTMHYGI